MNEGNKNSWTAFEIIAGIICFLCILVTYIRAFFGSEITDEAYYISNAITIMHGNLPFAYNNEALTFGAPFVLVPQLFIYEQLVPSLKGVFLFTRISFVTFKIIILVFSYKLLRTKYERRSVLCGLAILIPYSAGIANYSYNSVASFLAFLTALILFDAIEGSGSKRELKIGIAGALSSLVFFSHFAYAAPIVTFATIVIIRSKKGEKLRNMIAYTIGGVIEVLIVLVPIAAQSGAHTLLKGLLGYIFSFPTQEEASDSWINRLNSTWIIAKPYFIFLIFAALLAIVTIVTLSQHEKGKKYLKSDIIVAVLLVFYVACMYYMYDRNEYDQWINYIGLISAIFLIPFVCLLSARGYSIVIYTSVYPIVLAIGMMILSGTNSPIVRFGAVIPAISGLVIVLLENKQLTIKTLTVITVGICMALIGYSQCRFVYRDSELSSLKYQVREGVYAGIFTTEQRANDLPEMESYLNSLIKKDEYYAFRDNVPFAYLMNRKGQMCDLNTWDCLNYSYHGNNPARLYAYYERRGCIPDRIVYIDFGRDVMLSVDNDGFRYNAFVDSYYSLTDDFALNETFFHIKVYEYKGNFDGNIDYWIDSCQG